MLLETPCIEVPSGEEQSKESDTCLENQIVEVLTQA